VKWNGALRAEATRDADEEERTAGTLHGSALRLDRLQDLLQARSAPSRPPEEAARSFAGAGLSQSAKAPRDKADRKRPTRGDRSHSAFERGEPVRNCAARQRRADGARRA